MEDIGMHFFCSIEDVCMYVLVYVRYRYILEADMFTATRFLLDWYLCILEYHNHYSLFVSRNMHKDV